MWRGGLLVVPLHDDSLTTSQVRVNRAPPRARVHPGPVGMGPVTVAGWGPVMARGLLHRRSRLALVALLGLGLAVPACRTRASGPRVRLVRQPAVGRPDVCPDDAVDAYGDGTPGPMDLRCSYADGSGGLPTRVRGRVLVETPGGPGASPGRTTVIVYEAPRTIDGPPGRAVAEATTDPQGSFSVGAMLAPGEYLVAVPGRVEGRPRASRRITVGGEAGHQLEDVRLMIPQAMDPSDTDP